MRTEQTPKSQTKVAPPSPTRLASKFHVAWKTAATSTSASAKSVMPAPRVGSQGRVSNPPVPGSRELACQVSRGGSFFRGRGVGDEDHAVPPVQVPGELDGTLFSVPRRPRDPERRHVRTYPEHSGGPGVERGRLQLLPAACHREAVPPAHEVIQTPAEILPQETGRQTLRQVILLQNERLAVPGAYAHDDVYSLIFRKLQPRNDLGVAQVRGFDRARVEYLRPYHDAASPELIRQSRN